VIAGIDPGFQGAFAVISDGGNATSIDVPILVVGNGKKEKPVFDVQEMDNLVRTYLVGASLVGIEEVGPRPMEGVVSVFRFGEGYGIWRGLLAAHKIPYIEVTPSSWKRAMFGTRGMEKDASVALAEKLFPSLSFRTPRGRLLDGRAEALLIAEYVRRQRVQGKL